MLSSEELGTVQLLYILAMMGRQPSTEVQAKAERLIQKQLVARGAAYDHRYDLPTWERTIQQLKSTTTTETK